MKGTTVEFHVVIIIFVAFFMAMTPDILYIEE